MLAAAVHASDVAFGSTENRAERPIEIDSRSAHGPEQAARSCAHSGRAPVPRLPTIAGHSGADPRALSRDDPTTDHNQHARNAIVERGCSFPMRQEVLAPTAGTIFHNSPFCQPLVDGRRRQSIDSQRSGTAPARVRSHVRCHQSRTWIEKK